MGLLWAGCLKFQDRWKRTFVGWLFKIPGQVEEENARRNRLTNNVGRFTHEQQCSYASITTETVFNLYSEFRCDTTQ